MKEMILKSSTKLGSVGLLGWAVAVVFAFVACQVNAQACTPSTCPDGPVMVIFEHANCTGDYSFYGLGYEIDVCYNQSFPVLQVKSQDDDLAIFISDSRQCDLELPDTTYFGYLYRFGACGNIPSPLAKKDKASSTFPDFASGSLHDGSSLVFGSHRSFGRNALDASHQGRMYLRNVNESFTSPQPFFQFDANIPALNEDPEDCYSPYNCTLPSGKEAPYYQTQYPDDYNCSAPQTSIMYPHIEHNTCYNGYNNSYMKFGCYTGNVRVISYFFDSSCDATPAGHYVQHATCSNFVDAADYCVADISPISTPSLTPPSNSSANTLVSSFASILLALLAITL